MNVACGYRSVTYNYMKGASSRGASSKDAGSMNMPADALAAAFSSVGE